MNTILNKKGLNVLSLFDGLSAAKLSLDMANIHIDNYYSSEICKNAIQLQNFHYSADTSFHQIGDVRRVNGADYKHVDLIIGGFPCTNLTSINGKDRTGVTGTSESSLFYEFIRIIKEIKQSKTNGDKLYIVVENVNSMDRAMKQIITEEISIAMDEHIKPIMIDASRCCGSIRRRLFWSNLPITQPEDKKITYQSCIKNGYVDKDKSNVILGSQLTNVKGIYRYKKYKLGNLIYKNKEYTTMDDDTLFKTYEMVLKESNHQGKAGSVKDEYDFVNGFYRIPSISECSTLLSVPEDYVKDVPDVSKTGKYKMLGLTFSPCVVSHILGALKDIF